MRIIQKQKKESANMATQNKKVVKKEKLVNKLEKIVKVNQKTGVSRWIKIKTLVGHDSRFAVGNGGGWCRDDGQVGKKYIIEKKRGAHNRILMIRLAGYNTQTKEVKDKQGIIFLDGKKYSISLIKA
jgi:hypothetical protein